MPFCQFFRSCRITTAVPIPIGSMLTFCLWFCISPSLVAGLASSDLVVVVNGDSLNSRTLANYYVNFRKIPARNVIVLNSVPDSEIINVDEFRQRILLPVLKEIAARKLDKHIQCISYSADFPTAIDISADMKPLGELPIYFTRLASINSLTFLYERVLKGDAGQYISLDINFYARRPIESYFTSPVGNLTQPAWDAAMKLVEDSEHGAAADALMAILKDHPWQFPVAYLAAAEAALADDKPRAIELLKLAINAGWAAGGYLDQDKRFDALRDDGEFQILELSLDDSIVDFQPSIAFDARLAWTPNGLRVGQPKVGLHYMLSTVLGVTRGGGTSLPEAISALERAALADSTHPQGGFYFCSTKDVRTTTREPAFAYAIEQLKALGFEAEVVKSRLPLDKPAVLGAQLGIAKFDWSESNSSFVPGAIAENLTSLGGVMTSRSGQTKLSELIKAGAAGSSGTVTEPYSLQAKFPHPQLYVHYARGASLAEAFYLSVTGPYQLLVVGDPLCQPFSNAPDPRIDQTLRHLAVDEPLQLELDISGPRAVDWTYSDQPRALNTTPLAAAVVGVLFDGTNPQTSPIQSRIAVRLNGQTPGYHEITLRVAADDPTIQRRDTSIPIWIGEPGVVELSFSKLQGGDDGQFSASMADQNISVQVAAVLQGSRVARVTLWHDAEQLAVASGDRSEFIIPLKQLGQGPVRLQAKVELDNGNVLAGIPTILNVVD